MRSASRALSTAASAARCSAAMAARASGGALRRRSLKAASIRLACAAWSVAYSIWGGNAVRNQTITAPARMIPPILRRKILLRSHM